MKLTLTMGADYKILAKEARKKILSMVYQAHTSHIASNFSVIDIATVLYENLGPNDEVVWSKGWAAATIYYFLAKQGKIPVEDLEKFPNPPYLGLAETTVNGVVCNGGAVGHGTPIAVGMALGKKRAGEKGIVYCIMSDGELNEGTVWESAMLAAHHKLDNLVFIIDKNDWQAMGKTSEVIDLEPLENRWRGFGWACTRIDGHDYNAIQDALALKSKDSPLVVICDTIKGSGGHTACDMFEHSLLYHYKHVEKDEYERALKLLSQDSLPRMSR